ncbi:MAG: hypothetical protein ACRDBG_08305 [Waterburya sp.]
MSKKAISKLPLHEDFNGNCSLEQQFDCFVKGLMVGVESIFEQLDSKYCKNWIVTIVKRYFHGSENLELALDKVEYYYRNQPAIDRKESELVYRSQLLAKNLRNTQFEQEAEFVVLLAETQTKQIETLQKILQKN